MNGLKALLLLQVHYPGGLSSFEEQGGSCFLADKELFIYSPAMDEKILLKIKQEMEKEGLEVIHRMTPNFDDMSQEQIKESHSEIINYLVSNNMEEADIVVTKPVFVISLPDKYKSTSLTVKKLVKYLKGIKGLVEARVYCKDKTIPVKIPTMKRRKPTREEIVYSKQKITRETVINDDDIVNLKIALESSKSLEEFINTI